MAKKSPKLKLTCPKSGSRLHEWKQDKMLTRQLGKSSILVLVCAECFAIKLHVLTLHAGKRGVIPRVREILPTVYGREAIYEFEQEILTETLEKSAAKTLRGITTEENQAVQIKNGHSQEAPQETHA